MYLLPENVDIVTFKSDFRKIITFLSKATLYLRNPHNKSRNKGTLEESGTDYIPCFCECLKEFIVACFGWENTDIIYTVLENCRR